ncbi:MAG TPA: hypothetical protein VKY27_07815 [Bacteriovoracaceae bacterium]|nr:hypothetical protein [Bacteriovoracaceae bacterium]
MKLLLMLSVLVANVSWAKVVISKDQLFLETTAGRTPLSSLNTMLEKREVKKLKLHGDGKAHIVSFAKKNGDVRNYSIDHRGFIYDIEPFSKYTITKVHPNGDIEFKETPGKRYKITSEGYYVY